MGKKKVEEVKEVEEVKPVEPVKEVKQKKKRSEKQIEAFNKMRGRLAEKKAKATEEPAEPKAEPIPSKPLERKETVELEVKNEVIPKQVERKEIKKEVLPPIEEEQEDFSNFDYNYNYQPEPVAFKVGRNTYSTQALKSYKNSLQYKRQFRPPIIDKSIFF
jgi:hypothetical protein